MKKVILVCDLCLDGDEEEATETVAIKLNGYGSKLDVCDDHKKEIEEALLGIMEHGAETGEKPGAKKKATTPKAKAQPQIDTEQAKHIREWARKNGYTVSNNGRIPADILDAYNEAH